MSWSDIDVYKHQNEGEAARSLMGMIRLNESEQKAVNEEAVEIVRRARRETRRKGLMETFLEEFGLSNNEGLALMCLAESLLRVPDAETADKLIAEKIASGDWDDHKGQSDSWLVNASTWGLMLTGRIVDVEAGDRFNIGRLMHRLTKRAGEPVIRAAMMQAMRIMGEQFVVGRNIKDAIRRSGKLGLKDQPGLASFDMLGEGARTYPDAARYMKAYKDAIHALGESLKGQAQDPEDVHGISVKLSALHPRYDVLHEDTVMTELYPGLCELAKSAAEANINLCVDAEEADRLLLSLRLFERLAREPDLKGWQGLGLAVQAYQKRSPYVIDRLVSLARETGQRFMIRLVKGAYWDSEIKHSQVEGHTDYPVWTRKSTTDVCYLACARKLLEAGDAVYPQFATHNAHTVAAIQHMATADHEFEFQRLHGMGEALYRAVERKRRVRIYAPVGAHEDLLPYLVRRLLENGANTSFVHSFLDDDVPAEDVARSPFTEAAPTRHPQIPLPADMFGDSRKNSEGADITQASVRKRLAARAAAFKPIQAGPLISGKFIAKTEGYKVMSPTDASVIGTCTDADPQDIAKACEAAADAFNVWNARGGKARGDILFAMADALESHMDELIALMAQEAGKTAADAIAEVREAVDFCRYYGAQAARDFAAPERLPGPAGETNHLSLMGRGVFLCISPWNFPVAIFAGQVAAALAAGNTVVAKPAEQTPLCAYRVTELFFEAGLPTDVLHLLPGDGESVGAALTERPEIVGVCFTGSTEVAKIINRTLADKDGPIPVLIAETGGLNGMFVDTTALREQVIDDVVASAFNAAGQRCSALRIVFLPEETADMIVTGIEEAMDALFIGRPDDMATDVGPVIDTEARKTLQTYVDHLPEGMRVRKQCDVPHDLSSGTFFPPTLIEADSLDGFEREMFGPILHIVRYTPDNLDDRFKAFAAKGYGLTLGVHSRLKSFADRVMTAVPAGNVYINRNIIGAVVGVQPFGGQGLSGTGPKAGGPHYLARFATERTVTDNITAQGGDPALLNLDA